MANKNLNTKCKDIELYGGLLYHRGVLLHKIKVQGWRGAQGAQGLQGATGALLRSNRSTRIIEVSMDTGAEGANIL